jgi:4-hydroxy-2-oxoheptanedioate aldolase
MDSAYRVPQDGGNADGEYTRTGMTEYMELANRERFVAIQIEDPEPLDQLEEIAALEGIDMLFFGPADFSQGIGAPGQWDDPRIKETRKRVAEVAVRHGKFAGTPGSPDTLNELVDMGYRFLPMGADVLALVPYFEEIAAKLLALNK